MGGLSGSGGELTGLNHGLWWQPRPVSPALERERDEPQDSEPASSSADSEPSRRRSGHRATAVHIQLGARLEGRAGNSITNGHEWNWRWWGEQQRAAAASTQADQKIGASDGEPICVRAEQQSAVQGRGSSPGWVWHGDDRKAGNVQSEVARCLICAYIIYSNYSGV